MLVEELLNEKEWSQAVTDGMHMLQADLKKLHTKEDAKKKKD